jgi:hypothetical protein
MWKRKEGDKRKQTFDARIYSVVSVGIKPPLVHIVEALTKSITFRSPNLFRDSSWLATKAHAKSPGYLDAPSLRSFPRRRGLLVPRTKLLSPLHTKPEGRRLADESQRL